MTCQADSWHFRLTSKLPISANTDLFLPVVPVLILGGAWHSSSRGAHEGQ